MNTKKKIAVLSLLAFSVFGSLKAQNTNDNTKTSQNNSVSKTELKAPIVKKGDAGDATFASYHDRLAIHIIARNDGNMPAQKYATMLANAFADRKYTDKPIYITVTYEKRDTAGETQAIIYMDGGAYKTKDGYNVFTPEQIGAAIKTITHIYVARHGDKHVLKDKNALPAILLN